MAKKRTSVAPNSVPVQLEKATEFDKKEPVLQVNPQILSALKSSQQLSEEQERQSREEAVTAKVAYYRKKAYFYGGLFGMVALMWLGFRYFKIPKPSGAILNDVLNGTTSLVAQ
jgi:hypothetical protein